MKSLRERIKGIVDECKDKENNFNNVDQECSDVAISEYNTAHDKLRLAIIRAKKEKNYPVNEFHWKRL